MGSIDSFPLILSLKDLFPLLRMLSDECKELVFMSVMFHFWSFPLSRQYDPCIILHIYIYPILSHIKICVWGGK